MAASAGSVAPNDIEDAVLGFARDPITGAGPWGNATQGAAGDPATGAGAWADALRVHNWRVQCPPPSPMTPSMHSLAAHHAGDPRAPGDTGAISAHARVEEWAYGPVAGRFGKPAAQRRLGGGAMEDVERWSEPAPRCYSGGGPTEDVQRPGGVRTGATLLGWPFRETGFEARLSRQSNPDAGLTPHATFEAGLSPFCEVSESAGTFVLPRHHTTAGGRGFEPPTWDHERPFHLFAHPTFPPSSSHTVTPTRAAATNLSRRGPSMISETELSRTDKSGMSGPQISDMSEAESSEWELVYDSNERASLNRHATHTQEVSMQLI
jgi:hypothetical protein